VQWGLVSCLDSYLSWLFGRMKYNLHSKSIDALRGIAASTVFFAHSDTSGLATNAWLSANKGFLGDFGVYVFFCLSGYLIWQSGSRLIGANQGLSRYVIHRFTRLVPLYLFNIFIITVLLGYIGSRWVPQYDFTIILRHLVFSQDLYPSVSRAINPVLWTLTHEVTYYILVPLILIVGIRSKTAILLASLVLYAVFLKAGWVGYLRFVEVFYAFAFGIYIAEANVKEQWVACVLAGAITAYALVGGSVIHPYAGRIAGIAFAMIIIALTKGKECSQTVSRLMTPLVFLGVISYSLYIWHYQIIYVVEYYYPFFNHHIPGWSKYGLVSGAILSALCVFVSWLSYRFIEKPSMTSMRVKLEKRFASVPVGAH